MREPKWLPRSIVLAIHDEAIAEFGGHGEMRDNGLLESALKRPNNLFAYGEAPSLFDLAAALCHGIVKNHPFLDGNKRTGLLSVRAFLFINGQIFEPAETDEVEIMVGVANGRVSTDDLTKWFETFSSPKGHVR